MASDSPASDRTALKGSFSIWIWVILAQLGYFIPLFSLVSVVIGLGQIYAGFHRQGFLPTQYLVAAFLLLLGMMTSCGFFLYYFYSHHVALGCTIEFAQTWDFSALETCELEKPVE